MRDWFKTHLPNVTIAPCSLPPDAHWFNNGDPTSAPMPFPPQLFRLDLNPLLADFFYRRWHETMPPMADDETDLWLFEIEPDDSSISAAD